MSTWILISAYLSILNFTSYSIYAFLSLYTAPLPSGVGECAIQSTLGEYGNTYVQYSVPTGGFTLNVDVTGSEVAVYGSFTERNPNPITAEFETRGSGRMRFYISSPISDESKRRKRQTEAVNSVVYLNFLSLEENRTAFVNITSHLDDETTFGE